MAQANFGPSHGDNFVACFHGERKQVASSNPAHESGRGRSGQTGLFGTFLHPTRMGAPLQGMPHSSPPFVFGSPVPHLFLRRDATRRSLGAALDSPRGKIFLPLQITDLKMNYSLRRRKM